MKKDRAGLDRDGWRFPPALFGNFTDKYILSVVKHQGCVKLCGIVPLVLLVSLICWYGNKNKRDITREEQVQDGWQCFLSRSEAVNITVTVATFLCSTVWSRLGKINRVFFPQIQYRWGDLADVVSLLWGAPSLYMVFKNTWTQAKTHRTF